MSISNDILSRRNRTWVTLITMRSARRRQDWLPSPSVVARPIPVSNPKYSWYLFELLNKWISKHISHFMSGQVGLCEWIYMIWVIELWKFISDVTSVFAIEWAAVPGSYVGRSATNDPLANRLAVLSVRLASVGMNGIPGEPTQVWPNERIRDSLSTLF
jgi:hypothetical protein